MDLQSSQYGKQAYSDQGCTAIYASLYFISTRGTEMGAQKDQIHATQLSLGLLRAKSQMGTSKMVDSLHTKKAGRSRTAQSSTQ